MDPQLVTRFKKGSPSINKDLICTLVIMKTAVWRVF